MLLRTSLLLYFFALTGCAAVDLTTYQAERPELRLEEYFNGRLDAWGMFQMGEVTLFFKKRS